MAKLKLTTKFDISKLRTNYGLPNYVRKIFDHWCLCGSLCLFFCHVVLLRGRNVHKSLNYSCNPGTVFHSISRGAMENDNVTQTFCLNPHATFQNKAKVTTQKGVFKI